MRPDLQHGYENREDYQHRRGPGPSHQRRGSCAKGAAIFQTTASNEHRLTKVLYRAPGADKWEAKSWDWALTRIAKKIKETRDKDFIVKNAAGQVVNRVESIAHMGSSKVDNEECWSITTMVRALGIVHVDHQARV